MLGSALQGLEAGEGARELRAGALGFFASVLRRFPHAADYAPLWPRLLAAAEPLLPRLVAEVGSGSVLVSAWERPSPPQAMQTHCNGCFTISQQTASQPLQPLPLSCRCSISAM